MSDVNAVAEVMGIPAELVSRSASARATAAGSTTEEILEAWGGGAPAPKAAPPPESAQSEAAEEATTTSEDTAAEELAPPAAPVVPQAPQTPSTETTPASDMHPPILVGAKDNPMTIVAASALLFVAAALLAVLGPSIPTEAPGARTSHIALTEAGLEGQLVYGTLGCAYCHTQMVRPIIADVGLGPVTLSDTNEVLGVRRYGPDLSNVGNRLSGPRIEDTIRGNDGHPVNNLSDTDMSNLVAYLAESAPTGGGQ